MRKLTRQLPGPICLSDYDHNTQKWTINSPNFDCRNDIWESLNSMQNEFCAYCEGHLAEDDRHIEHFRNKGFTRSDGSKPYKNLTFEWGNLFGCCGKTSSETCGHFKDLDGSNGPGAYSANCILKPDVDDPALFFNFFDTGVIEAKEDLSEDDKNKALETIRVLNLEHLNGARRNQIDIYKKQLQVLEELEGSLSEEEFQVTIDAMKEDIKSHEFQSAVLGALF